MNKEIFETITSACEAAIPEFKEDTILFSQNGYDAVPLSIENFHPIRESFRDCTVCFIDGGNAEIVATASFSLQLIRVYAAFYKNNKRVDTRKYDFFALISAKNRNGEIWYESQLFSNNQFNEQREAWKALNVYTYKTPLRTPISEVGNVIRRFAEIALAKEAIQSMQSHDVIVLDGVLKATYTHEKNKLEDLYNAADVRGVIVSALAKTTQLLTTNANSAAALLSSLKKGSWMYHPVADITHESHCAEMCFTRLHEKSKYVFRFELFKPQREHLHEVLSLLSKNSTDAAFIGYPYGLIDADHFARISKQEQEQLQLRLRVLMKTEKLEPYLNSLNAHSILDSIR